VHIRFFSNTGSSGLLLLFVTLSMKVAGSFDISIDTCIVELNVALTFLEKACYPLHARLSNLSLYI